MLHRSCIPAKSVHPLPLGISRDVARATNPLPAAAHAQVYEGLTFKLSLKFPTSYPYEAPAVTFLTPCFHPNVDQYGNICLDILKEKWSASYSVQTILQSLRSLLGDPNNDSPLNGYAAQLWENQSEYKKVLLKKYSEDATSEGVNGAGK
mgnify:CR=1 FL=1